MRNSEARKRVEQQAAWSEPDWSPSEACCDQHGRVLAALRRVYGSCDMGEAVALTDALDEFGLLR